MAAVFNDAVFIQSVAARHQLPPVLITSIVTQESSGNPWAFRFEPAFLARYVEPAPRRFGEVSIESERMGRATSWGLMQVMGQVARERGFLGVYLPELCEPGTGIEYGCRQLALLRTRYLASDGWAGVIAAYNAGSPRRSPGDKGFVNQQYVDEVLSRMGGAGL